MEGNVLFIGFKKPVGVLDGGGLTNLRNLRVLQTVVGAERVDEYYVNREGEKRNLFELLFALLLMPFGYYNGLTPKKLHEIVSQADKHSIIYLSTSLFGKVAKVLKKKGYQGTIIAHFHNDESQYYSALIPKYAPYRAIVINCVKKNDQYSCNYADTVISLNQRDSRQLLEKYGKVVDHIIPITLKDVCEESKVDLGVLTRHVPKCLFVGRYFPANVDGLKWFINNVLPYVSIELTIVGKGMAELQAFVGNDKRVLIYDSVPEISSFYYDADFVILPIFTGGGMKVKTCESLMYGKNIIGSEEAFEGYELEDDLVGGRCQTAQDYIKVLNEFSANPVLRFNRYSRDLFLKKYSESTLVSVYQKIIRLPR